MWSDIPLGEIAPANGDPLPSDSQRVWNLSLEDIEPITGRVIEKRYNLVSELGSAKCCFNEQHVLYSKLRPYLNKVVVPDGAGVGTSELIPLRPDPKRINRDFLAYYLRSPRFLAFTDSNTRGANLPRISMKELWKHSIPVPDSVSKQRRIVARIKECLGKVDEVEALRYGQGEEVDSLFPALVNESFNGVQGAELNLADVCAIEGSLIDPKETKYRQLKHIGGANIVAETGQLHGLKTAEEEKLISGKFLFTEEDVLYSKIRPYLKKVARPDFTGLCSADIYPVRPFEDKILRDFLYYLLLTSHFTDYAIKVSNRAGMPKVNRKQLFAYSFICPLLTDQERIVSKLNDAYQNHIELKSALEDQKPEMAALRESILHQAFSDEL